MERILPHIKEDEIVKLAMDLVNIPSPTGKERGVGEYILQWFHENGIKSIRQDLTPNRMNIVGIIEGSGEGVSLSFNGHMDVPYSGTSWDLQYMTKEDFDRPEHQPNAFVRNGKIYGLGIGNMKAGLAAMLTMFKAIKKSGIPLKGNLIAAVVAGEVSMTSVGDEQGIDSEGTGVGTRYLLSRGIHSDYAICADNSNLKLNWVQPGVVCLRITSRGLPGAAWATGQTISKATSQNAIIRMIPIMEALEKWSDGFSKRNIYECEGGTVIPSAQITNIEAGIPSRVSLRPGVCRINFYANIPPDIKPIEIEKEIRKLVREVEGNAEVEMVMSCLGYETKGAAKLIDTVKNCYEQLFGSKLAISDPPYTSRRSDSNIYNEWRIPCINIGCGLSAGERLTRGNAAYDEHPIEDMVKAAKLFSKIVVETCTKVIL